MLPSRLSGRAYGHCSRFLQPTTGRFDILSAARQPPERKERVVHVGMYIGGKRFIHSQGDVHISSFDLADELFDEYNLGRLLFTRVLPYINKEAGLNTTETNEYYK